jgi:hypothetical protein
MTGSINDFKSSFKTDVARPSRFDVSIPIPLTLIPFISTSRQLIYRCEAAQLPGRTFATAEQKTYGPIEKFPYLTTYNDIDLTFIVSSDMSEKIFFDNWLNYVNPLYNNNFHYKEDYAVPLTINQYDSQGNLTYSVNLIDAYPVSMNQLDLDWSADGHHKLVITFAYTYWKNNSLQALGIDALEAGIATVADLIGGLGGNALTGLGTSITDTTLNNIAGNISGTGGITQYLKTNPI